MATSRISAFTLGLAAKLTDASTFVGNDSDGITRKWTLALLRTQLNAGAQAFTGMVTFGGGAMVTGGTLASGANVYKNAVDGLTVVGIVGSSHDLFMANAAGNAVLRVPTGTQNVLFSGIAVFGTTTLAGASAGDVVLKNTGALRSEFGATTFSMMAMDANGVVQLGDVNVRVCVPKVTGVGASANIKGFIHVDTGTAGQLVFFDGVTGARYKLVGTAF